MPLPPGGLIGLGWVSGVVLRGIESTVPVDFGSGCWRDSATRISRLDSPSSAFPGTPGARPSDERETGQRIGRPRISRRLVSALEKIVKFGGFDLIIVTLGDRNMNQFYYDAVTKMEQMGVDDEYIQGWQCGFLQNPKREEQRLTDAYEAGYSDGEEKSTDNFGNWAQG